MLEAKRNFFLGQKFHSYNSALQVKMNRFLKTKFSSTLFQRPVKWFMIQFINYVSKVPFQVACVYNFLFKFQLQKSWQRPLCVANNFAQWKIRTVKKFEFSCQKWAREESFSRGWLLLHIQISILPWKMQIRPKIFWLIFHGHDSIFYLWLIL